MRDETKQPKRLTAEAVQAITSALHDFGYKDLTDDRVRERIRQIAARRRNRRESGIIAFAPYAPFCG